MKNGEFESWTVTCDKCEEEVCLVMVEGTGHQLQCGCDYAIDVGGQVTDNNLFDPISGHWSDLDAG